MNEIKDKYVLLFQGALLSINCIAVVLICAFIYITTEQIRKHYVARDFLNTINKVPYNPKHTLIFCTIMMLILIVTFILRNFCNQHQSFIKPLSFGLDAVICVLLVYRLDFNYNGLLLLLCANIIAYIKDKKIKFLYIAMAIIGYVIADYNLLSIYMPLCRVSDYIQYYSSSVQQYLYSFYNITISMNIVLFIIYCIYVINTQNGMIEEVNRLYHELQTANRQLQDYANMSERMAQTRERNRLAREIHDTLGHTLTGIAAGLDACLALIDISVDQTKKQLKLLAQVSRDGIKDIRRSVNELRPDALERLSLEVAIRKMVSEMSQVSDVEIYFETEEQHMKFDEDEENAIYRVIQESITNSVRHGKAKRIWITLVRKDGEIILIIHDDGIGCKDIKSGFGTKHIKERIEMLKGTVSFEGKNGFTVTAHIPIRWGETYD